MVLSVCIYILMYQRSFENQVSVDVPIQHVISNDWPIIQDNMSYRHIYRDLITRYPFSSLNIQVVMATCLMFLIYSPDMSATYHVNNRDISQIPQCTNSISHYTPFCYRNVHISVTKCCIVWYLTDALWDLWDGSIEYTVSIWSGSQLGHCHASRCFVFMFDQPISRRIMD